MTNTAITCGIIILDVMMRCFTVQLLLLPWKPIAEHFPCVCEVSQLGLRKLHIQQISQFRLRSFTQTCSVLSSRRKVCISLKA